ncbi:MAG: YraN family protein [Candidatus Bathyarchaeia archaeon]
MLRKLQSEGVIYLEDNAVSADSDSRLKLAVRAVELGADIQQIGSCLRWQEFEDIAAVALEKNGYNVTTNVHFKHDGRRWEIDVVGCRRPLVVCVDCKRWRRSLHPSALEKMAAAQAERVEAFADVFPHARNKAECARWDRATFVPVILSLLTVGSKYCEKVPVVPVLQLQDFLSQLPACLDSVRYLSRKFSHL